MEGASRPPPPSTPKSLSLIASILTAAALAPNASAVVGASPAAIEALNIAAAAALGAVRGAIQDVTPLVPAAASGPPAESAPAAAAVAAPAVPAVAAPAAPFAQCRNRGKIMLDEKLLLITQVADRVPRETLALRYGVTKREIYGVWAERIKTWDAVARGVPLRALC